jgi:hypothetical protein
MKYFGLIILLANVSSCRVLQEISEDRIEQQVLKDSSRIWNYYGFQTTNYFKSSTPISITYDSLTKQPDHVFRKMLKRYSITINNYPLDVKSVFPKALVLSRNNFFTGKNVVVFSGLADSLQQKRISRLKWQYYKKIGPQLYILSRKNY